MGSCGLRSLGDMRCVRIMTLFLVISQRRPLYTPGLALRSLVLTAGGLHGERAIGLAAVLKTGAFARLECLSLGWVGAGSDRVCGKGCSPLTLHPTQPPCTFNPNP